MKGNLLRRISSKKSKLILFSCFILILLAIILAIIIPQLISYSNCGGNSAALAACKQSSLIMIYESKETGKINIEKISDNGKQALARALIDNSWINAEFYLKKGDIKLSDKKKHPEIIIVCDTMYDNVPQPTIYNFYKKTPRHAAGLSDYSTKLINGDEFSRINLKEYISAKEYLMSYPKQD